MAKSIFIGFDFSMNKPAATILYDKQFHFFIWPADITKKNPTKAIRPQRRKPQSKKQAKNEEKTA